jgi:light-regulated signal transduction histidine kinase (bacteriophytochrome)
VLIAFPTELKLLFQNLIGNAIKYRKANIAPVIQIAAERVHTGWEFTISDNGIGIEEKYKDKIFMIFQRLHTRNKYEGNGIGLAHCKKIAELHEGKIWVESTIGVGSKFYFYIPDKINIS